MPNIYENWSTERLRSLLRKMDLVGNIGDHDIRLYKEIEDIIKRRIK